MHLDGTLVCSGADLRSGGIPAGHRDMAAALATWLADSDQTPQALHPYWSGCRAGHPTSPPTGAPMMNDNTIIADGRFPRWRARLVPDEDASEPCGDALAPAMIIGRCGETLFAKEVYQPAQAGWIVSARRHFGDHDLFERYLRIFHGTTCVVSASDRDITVLIFDTGDYRSHAGITGRTDLAGEQAEWQAWLDGDVYGVIVEHHHTGITRWDDDTTSMAQQWHEADSVWGFYGHSYAAWQAQRMLHDCASA